MFPAWSRTWQVIVLKPSPAGNVITFDGTKAVQSVHCNPLSVENRISFKETASWAFTSKRTVRLFVSASPLLIRRAVNGGWVSSMTSKNASALFPKISRL